ncbi:hypothetical protein KQX54_021472 [Cotesia glomerata]|uniref:Uncharacterized protein n=1 Tax=Cotesia glomerata TaxID=32391 RepID=A0AAV7J6T9_COTGL|nr:hypothetical protein KQX54_021472 [Cotesia glomerata]
MNITTQYNRNLNFVLYVLSGSRSYLANKLVKSLGLPGTLRNSQSYLSKERQISILLEITIKLIKFVKPNELHGDQFTIVVTVRFNTTQHLRLVEQVAIQWLDISCYHWRTLSTNERATSFTPL